MYGFSIKQIPITHSTLVYNHLLDGSMAIGDDYAPPLQPNQTYKGISLVDSENPSLLEKLGDDMILFTEWCQNWCSWRRRGYLVVVNELTRIIHNQFSNAQIEVVCIHLFSLVVWQFSHWLNDPIFRCRYCNSQQ